MVVETPRAQVSRRNLIGRGAALIGSAGLLAACAPATGVRGSGSTPPGGGSHVPAHVAYQGPPPDLPGTGDGTVPGGYLTYPAPIRTLAAPLALSMPVTAMLQGVPSAVAPAQSLWWKQFETDLGTTLSVTAVHSTDYAARFQTMVAGDSLPDLVQITAVPKLLPLLERRFTDLTPYLGGDNVKKYPFLANIPTSAWDVCVVGGRIWGLTNYRIGAGVVLMTNGARLAEIGVPADPELRDGEAFLDLCRELTDAKRGVFAIGQVPHTWTVPLILEAMGGPNEWKVESNGEWVSAYQSPEFEAALEVVSKMFSERMLHPNSYSDLGASAAWFQAGTTGLFAQNFANFQNYAARTDFDAGVVVLPKWDGGGRANKHLGASGYVDPVGLRKTDDPARVEELLRLANYLASPFGTEEYLKVSYGVRGSHYDLRDGQIEKRADAPKDGVPGLAYFGSMKFSALYSAGHPEATRALHRYLGDVTPTGVANPRYGRFSDTAVSTGAIADRKINALMGDIIQGRVPLSAWKDGVTQWWSDAGSAMAREFAEGA